MKQQLSSHQRIAWSLLPTRQQLSKLCLQRTGFGALSKALPKSEGWLAVPTLMGTCTIAIVKFLSSARKVWVMQQGSARASGARTDGSPAGAARLPGAGRGWARLRSALLPHRCPTAPAGCLALPGSRCCHHSPCPCPAACWQSFPQRKGNDEIQSGAILL